MPETELKDLFGYVRPVSPVAGVPQHVCELFEQLALEIWRRGFRQYSARAILHRIRWHYHIERGDRDFKCNNNWTPAMARWFMNNHPEYGEFFETRSSPSDEDD